MIIKLDAFGKPGSHLAAVTNVLGFGSKAVAKPLTRETANMVANKLPIVPLANKLNIALGIQ